MKTQTKIRNHQSTISLPGRDLLPVAALAFAVSLISLSYYFQRSEILLNGDAIAHINIARRVFDSRTPGLLQLGTVWLPLPHLLMIPFLLSDGMWQTGIGGSIPSMLSYVFGVVGIFRLTRSNMEANVASEPVARTGPWVAALVYAANPNLIYLQTTAMTEPLYLALFVWAVVYFFEFMDAEPKAGSQWRKPPSCAAPGGTAKAAPFPRADHDREPGADKLKNSALWKCALCVAGAELTRYDGWLLAVVTGAAVFVMAICRWQNPRLRWTAIRFLLAIAVAPSLWLVYNVAVYGNPLEFANGSYSAKAIEQRTATAGMPSHPGAGNVVSAARYFLKSAELNMASGNWSRVWIVLAAAGLIVTFMRIRRYWPLLVLCIPLLFYAVSIAYGGVPLFVPAWWPFTFYNVRYGIELLPLFAVSAGLIVTVLGTSAAPQQGSVSRSLNHPVAPRPGATAAPVRRPDTNRAWSTFNELASTRNFQIAAVSVIVLIVVLSYFSVWKAQPLCLTEASVNSRTKLTLEAAVARTIRGLPHSSSYLMYLGDHVGVFQQDGIPLRQTINEGNRRPWRKPSDPQGLWERALADPARYTNYVIAFAGDPVDRAVDKSGLTVLSVIHTTGQAEARIYAAAPPDKRK